MVNVYLVKKSANPLIHLIYRVCAFCNRGQHQIEYYNAWMKGNGFKEKFIFHPSFSGNFNGADLKVGLKIEPPFAFTTGVTENGIAVCGGQDYWVLEYLSKSANFSLILVDQTEPPFICSQYHLLRHRFIGLYLGHCEKLANREVDMAGFPARQAYWFNHWN